MLTVMLTCGNITEGNMLEPKTKYKLYKKLFLWSRKKFREIHMELYKNDIKCPFCNEWFSISGIEHKHEYADPQPEFGVHVRCGQCKRNSYWNLVIAPVALRCEPDGTPIQDK